MFLELNRVLGSERETLFEIFSDQTGRFIFAAFTQHELPLEVMEEFIRRACSRLPPDEVTPE